MFIPRTKSDYKVLGAYDAHGILLFQYHQLWYNDLGSLKSLIPDTFPSFPPMPGRLGKLLAPSDRVVM